MSSHGANPVAGETDGDTVRVYFNCRDKQNRSHVAWVDLDLTDPLRAEVSGVSEEPVLAPGERGAFDDSGTSLGSLVIGEQETLLYYMGWNLGVSVPWRNSIGLAVRRHGSATYERYSRGPIMDRSDEDPLTLSYPWVIRAGSLWHMWYGSHTRWGGPTEFEHVLKYASSDDGVHWRRREEPVLTPTDADEYALSRPCVVRKDGLLHMLYCSRGTRYRIYQATSEDGVAWRGDPLTPVLAAAEEGWDSEMTCYPSVFEHQGVWYMLYNGNDYGREGFGIAVAE